MWWNAFSAQALCLDETKHSWYKDEYSGSLTSKFAPFNSLQAPDEMLKRIKGSYEQQWAAVYITYAWL